MTACVRLYTYLVCFVICIEGTTKIVKITAHGSMNGVSGVGGGGGGGGGCSQQSAEPLFLLSQVKRSRPGFIVSRRPNTMPNIIVEGVKEIWGGRGGGGSGGFSPAIALLFSLHHHVF